MKKMESSRDRHQFHRQNVEVLDFVAGEIGCLSHNLATFSPERTGCKLRSTLGCYENMESKLMNLF